MANPEAQRQPRSFIPHGKTKQRNRPQLLCLHGSNAMLPASNTKLCDQTEKRPGSLVELAGPVPTETSCHGSKVGRVKDSYSSQAAVVEKRRVTDTLAMLLEGGGSNPRDAAVLSRPEAAAAAPVPCSTVQYSSTERQHVDPCHQHQAGVSRSSGKSGHNSANDAKTPEYPAPILLERTLPSW